MRLAVEPLALSGMRPVDGLRTTYSVLGPAPTIEVPARFAMGAVRAPLRDDVWAGAGTVEAAADVLHEAGFRVGWRGEGDAPAAVLGIAPDVAREARAATATRAEETARADLGIALRTKLVVRLSLEDP